MEADRVVARASRTAEYMALFRAIESAGPVHRRLFHDPFAASFLSRGLKTALAVARVPLIGRFIPSFIDRRWPGARTSGVARTRLIDDWVLEALDRGVNQVAILGAGFDCRAYRLAHASGVRFFEIDQPGTSQVKQRVLQDRLGKLPAGVTFVQVDFNRQRLGPALVEAGFETSRRAMLLWEGVTNYLTADAVDSTLRWVGSLQPQTEIVFTYVDRRVLDDAGTDPGTARLRRTLSKTGETWTFGLDPPEVSRYLAARNLDLIEDLGAADYRRRYMGQPGTGYEFYWVVRARVTAC